MILSAGIAFFLSFGIIFAAEMGDRSQFITLALSARYRWRTILIGLSLASFFTLGLAAIAGNLLLEYIPKKSIDYFSIALLFFFAGYTLCEKDNIMQSQTTNQGTRAWLTIATTFFLAEFGDKTMLTTISLVTQYPVFLVWLGASSGLICANAITLVLGKNILSRLSLAHLRKIGAFCFYALALWQLLALDSNPRWKIGIIICATAALGLTCGVVFLRRNRHHHNHTR